MDRHAVSELVWQLSEGSVRGKSHVEAGLPNQDSVYVVTSLTGEVACAALCDGAGTAPRSGEGAQRFARSIAQRLCSAGERWNGSTGPTAEGVRAEAAIGIRAERDHLARDGGELRDFHCTLVAWLSMPRGSFIVQIGDSVALTTRFDVVRDGDAPQLDFFPEGMHRLHDAERGEYSNETHFVTEPDWDRHLRVVEVPADIDALVLMSDGAMDVAMLRGEVFRGFLSNLLAKLVETPGRAERNAVIEEWLGNPKTHRVTGDDKSAFIAVRAAWRAPEGLGIFLGQRRSEVTQPPPRRATPAARAPDPPTAEVLPAQPPRLTSEPPVAGAGRPRASASRRVLAPVAVPHHVVVGLATLAVGALAYLLYRAVVPASLPPAARAAVAHSDLDAIPARTLPAVPAPRPAEQVVAAPPRVEDVAAAFPEAPVVVAPRAVESGARADVAPDVLNASVRYEGTAALITVALRSGAPLTLTRAQPEAGLLLDANGPNGCRGGLVVHPGQSCRLVAKAEPDARAGEYAVELQFNRRAGGVFSYRVVVAVGRHEARPSARR